MEGLGKRIILFIIFLAILFIIISIGAKNLSLGNNTNTNTTNIIETNNEDVNKDTNSNTYKDVSKPDDKASFYYSNDYKYYLILTSNFRAFSNGEMGTRDRRYVMNIDEYYSTDSFTGTYEIIENKIILKVEAGCLDKDNKFTCVLPDNIKIEKKEDINYMSLDYNENNINFGNIPLYKQS